MRTTKTRRWAAIAATCAMLIGIGIGSQATAPPAQAADAAGFSAGNIISDANFHNAGAMSAAQVQGFLEGQVRSCAAGYTCLRDYRQDTWTRAADAQCSAYAGAGGERASTIIVKVAASCGVNPQVLLVLLQKEQALVTSSAPGASKYLYATGYACPDTAPCAAEFRGFYNQVYKAAWQYRYYENHPSSYRYRAGTVVDVQWHPNAACGTTRVYIENQATANLYIYTPYAPNAAALRNLYGTGDTCSSYGNRNFWRIYSDWFGSPNGPPSKHGALDDAIGVLGGIQVVGWAVDPYVRASAFVWVDIDGRGSALKADDPLRWVESLYPGYGANHGYDDVMPASPGTHRVCVSQTSGVNLGCRTVTVPAPARAAGSLDTAVGSLGRISVSGWSLDRTSAAQTYVWINVDGAGRAYKVDRDLPWTGNLYPDTGIRHGFTLDIPASAGTHKVCAYGVDSVLLRCRTATVPSNEAGAFESAKGVLGAIEVSGYSLDQRSPTPTYVWVDVDGIGRALKADRASTAANAAYPQVSGNHGFSASIPATPGQHRVCVTGTLEGRSHGCLTATVPNNEIGHVDSVTSPAYGAIDVTGWSLVQRSAESTWVWVDVDGRGQAVRANAPLAWTDRMYPGVGANHGFSTRIAATPGRHTVCVTGTKENVSYGCNVVDVASPYAAHVDAVTAVPGGVEISGWAVDRRSTATAYVWVDIDGRGVAVKANRPLSWVDSYFPGVGSDHGFDQTISTAPGSHRVCVTLTADGASLGCTTVVVP